MVTPGIVFKSLSLILVVRRRVQVEEIAGVAGPDEHCMDPLILPLHNELGHHHHVFGVHCAIGDPVFLWEAKVAEVVEVAEVSVRT